MNNRKRPRVPQQRLSHRQANPETNPHAALSVVLSAALDKVFEAAGANGIPQQIQLAALAEFHRVLGARLDLFAKGMANDTH